MPKAYEKIRDSFISKGVPTKKAKTEASKIYNSTPAGKKNPVHGKKNKEK